MYADALSETSTDYAPWFVIPADDKWFARLDIASVITRQFDRLNLSYPVLDKAQLDQLQKAKALLEAEDQPKDKNKREKSSGSQKNDQAWLLFSRQLHEVLSFAIVTKG